MFQNVVFVLLFIYLNVKDNSLTNVLMYYFVKIINIIYIERGIVIKHAHHLFLLQ